jgi:hypothetical protein
VSAERPFQFANLLPPRTRSVSSERGIRAPDRRLGALGLGRSARNPETPISQVCAGVTALSGDVYLVTEEDVRIGHQTPVHGDVAMM